MTAKTYSVLKFWFARARREYRENGLVSVHTMSMLSAHGAIIPAHWL